MELTVMERLQEQLMKGKVRDHSKARALFDELPLQTFRDLKDSELFTFLQSVLSMERMELFVRVLDVLQAIPYSSSYIRRSYRAPDSVKLYSARIVRLMGYLKNEQPYDFYAVFQQNATIAYMHSRTQFVTDDGKPIVSTELFTYELAVRLNAREPQLEGLVREILWKNGAHPLYGKELIRGIMMSEHEEMHALLANVLLAAKNQEGVRQVITESIDEGSLKAQLAFMKVIVEHDLLRFSSVVRAIDVWFGLGYDVSESRQLQYVLKTSYAALQDEALVETLLVSDSNLDVFIALWCMASRDIDSVLNRVDELLMREDYVQQTVLYTLRNMEISGRANYLVYPHMLQTDNVVTFLYGFPLVANALPYGSHYSKTNPQKLVQKFFEAHPWLTEHAAQWLRKVEQVSSAFSGDTYTIDKKPFTFLNLTFNRLQLFKLQLLLALYLKDDEYIAALAANVAKMSVECREYFYYFAPACTENYELLLPAMKDRSSSVRMEAIKQLKHRQYPLEKMKDYVSSLLTLKSGDLRIAVIELLKAQPIDQIEALATELLQSKKEQVRLGILELLIEVKAQLTTTDWTSYVASPSDKERDYLRQFEEDKKQSLLSEPVGAIHYSVAPKTDIFFTFKDFIHYDFARLKERLQPLRALIEAHKDVSYEQSGYYENATVLIGQKLEPEVNKDEVAGSIDELPLADVWVEWLVESDLTALDLCCYLYAKSIGTHLFHSKLPEQAQAFFDAYMPVERQPELFKLFNGALYERQLEAIIDYMPKDGDAPLQTKLQAHFQFDYVAFCSSMLRELASGDEADLGMSNGQAYRVIDIRFFRAALSAMGAYACTEQQVVQYFYTAALFDKRVAPYFKHASLKAIVIALNTGILTEQQVLRVLLMEDFQHVLAQGPHTVRTLKKYAQGDKMTRVLEQLQVFIVEQELARGDLQTETTKMVRHIQSIRGMDYFIRLLQALDGEKLNRQWVYSVQTRKESLCKLLEKVVPDAEESTEACFARLDAAGFSEARLIEAMLYNSAFIPLISAYIGWDGLEEVAWYFIAHTSESTNDYETAKIMEYSAIPMADFERGAFDRAWFMNARARLTKQQFDKVYAAAKYAASGSNHRRAQLYARATLGELDAVQLKEEITAKRNKDKLRAYGLLPASAAEAKERYLFFQQFLKESRSFGAQRRASEAEAVEMAIFNLAQQVTDNTTQFMWQMEQARYKELEKFFTPVEIDDVQLRLVVREQKVELEVLKNGKALKSVPKKLVKQEDVLAIQAAKKELTEQYRRTRQQLELSMCEELSFDAQIVTELLENQVIAELFRSLIWRQDTRFFAISNKQFVTHEQEAIHVVGAIQLAHPAHFYAAGNWRAWQRFVFEQGYVQPFKQVFREFYLPTQEEREKVFTNRFEGYQVQPTKAVALLKSRGWKTGYYEPVRKISYRYNLMTYVDFMYDAYTPAEVEAPTLEEIYFEWRLTYKKARLGEVPHVYFSEVMRDIDLVVSVAHAGEVDPEASHSTIELRAVIAEEMIQLFQLHHVEVKAPHIVIHGSLGDYTIHLGSGNVHQLGGAMIPVIAIPSQHRGRVFLPFVDEDPKTAEISAKLLLFAEDEKINDPTIRASIRK